MIGMLFNEAISVKQGLLEKTKGKIREKKKKKKEIFFSFFYKQESE
jgi:hypothetical protein